MSELEMPVLIALFILAGSVAGYMAGLLGIGGGAILVPVLFQTFIFLGLHEAHQMHAAVATSLTIIVLTSIQSGRVHYKNDAVDMTIVRQWAPFSVIGVVSGALLAGYFNAEVLKIIFAILTSLIALNMMFNDVDETLDGKMPIIWLQRGVASMIGFFSALMGIGGGAFSVTVMRLFGRPIHKAVGTAAVLGIFIALPGSLGFVVSGWGKEGLAPYFLGYVNWLAVLLLIPLTTLTAPMGARMAHRIDRKKLEKIFIFFLFLASARILWSVF